MSGEQINIYGSTISTNENETIIDHVSGSKIIIDEKGDAHIEHVSGLKIIQTADSQTIIYDEHGNLIHKALAGGV